MMSNTTLPAGGATSSSIGTGRPIGQSLPTNSVPWRGDRTIAYLQDSSPLSEISRFLQHNDHAEVSQRQGLKQHKPTPISHSLEGIINTAEDRSDLQGIAVKIEECIDHLEKNRTHHDLSEAKYNIEDDFDRLLGITHEKSETPFGAETSPTTGPGATEVATSHSDTLSHRADSQDAYQTDPAVASRQAERREKSPVPIPIQAHTVLVAKSVLALIQDAARLDAHQDHQLRWVALSGQRLGAHQIALKSRLLLQKNATLPLQSAISKAMGQVAHEHHAEDTRVAREIFNQGSKPLVPRSQKAVITDPNQPTAAPFQNKLKQPVNATVERLNRSGHENPALYHSLPLWVNQTLDEQRILQNLPKERSSLLTRDRPPPIVLFLALLEGMIDKILPIEPPVIRRQASPPPAKMPKKSLSTAAALQEQLETVERAVDEQLAWAKNSRDPCIAADQIEALLSLLETLIHQWQQQLPPKQISDALRWLREACGQLKHAKQLAAMACRKKKQPS